MDKARGGDKHRVLTRPGDIQAWVTARRGLPAIRRVPDHTGAVRAKLALRFGSLPVRPQQAPSLDDGMSPCSWSAWLAELERQQLALKVGGQAPEGCEIVDRKSLN
ncbi:hypothetical protein SAMN02983003_2495 [Devosia enhydra]|uniref:Uncharacterized protein n=1 Tax=Devosia enhydra TaxID=665118 RepID=A0A1K2HZ94_9HYPH|nr:hypothetical protein [Devosia enhydra]SFZ85297.1 hypothetical protein SAMN02983003_2495 [Devosia enhydra]